ncbi:MAG: rhodanese-related sulfurtransferase [Sphingomonadaceae bacterium]
MLTVAALYHFAPFDDPAALQGPLLELCRAQGVKGTILLAREGINGTIAGEGDAIAAVIAHIRALPGCAALDVKYSHAPEMPFLRLKVRLKNEIVTLGVPGIDPSRDVGRYVEPAEWNALISDPTVIVIDTRNDYEVAIGSFKGAINPKTPTFRDFPAWFREHRAALPAKPRVAMFCTGGIRCEKSTAFLRAEGIEDVAHLKGGILRYLETVPAAESLWEGECFVFDDRVSLTHGLEIGTLELCHGCRVPVSDDDKASPDYITGVQCPACASTRTDEQKRRYAERQKQIDLAKARGEAHLGDAG